MRITITGSLGHIGKPLTDQLVQNGHAVTVISSQPQRQQSIVALGATAFIASIDEPEHLAKAFENTDAVYCMIPPDFNELDQITYYERIGLCYANAIRRSGVKRVVNLSSYGAHLEKGAGFISGSYKVEKLLDAIPGIALTHIRPGFFYYNLLNFINMIKKSGFIGAVYGGEDKLAMVSPEDIACAVSEEIVMLNQPDKIRYVVSDDRTCNAVARALGKEIGKPDLEWKTLPQEQVLRSLLTNNVPENAAKNLVELGLATHSGVLREHYENNKPVFGKVKLQDFATHFAEVFNK